MWGARYTLGARYLSKNTVIVFLVLCLLVHLKCWRLWFITVSGSYVCFSLVNGQGFSVYINSNSCINCMKFIVLMYCNSVMIYLHFCCVVKQYDVSRFKY